MNLQTKVHKSWGDFKEPSQLLGPSLIYRYLYLFVFSSGASKGMKRDKIFFMVNSSTETFFQSSGIGEYYYPYVYLGHLRRQLLSLFL